MIEILIILLLAILNGIFALSETAVITARKVRLQQQAGEGSTRAQTALELAEDPNRFLSTVQIGITLIGVLAGAFGSATLADDLSLILQQIPFLAESSEGVAVVLIVVFTTYLSLVIGELVPKRLALLRPESTAMWIATPMQWLSRITAPIIWFLGLSTNVVLWLLRVQQPEDTSVTDEDIRLMMRQGAAEGIFAKAEPEMVAGALSLDDIPIASIMIPRVDVVWLDVTQSADEIKDVIINNKRSRFPVGEGDIDKVIGYVRSKELLDEVLRGEPLDLRSCLRQPLYIAETTPASRMLEMFKQSDHSIAIVMGEFGGVEGIITVNDIVEEVVGDIDKEDPEIVQRADGSWLVDALLPIDKFAELLEVKLPDETPYHTVSGLVLAELHHIPEASEYFEWEGVRIEVVDMDGKRIDKVLVSWVESPLADGGG